MAIMCNKYVKCVEKKEYDVEGLEAKWAEVMINPNRMIVESLNGGKSCELNKFELIVTRILTDYKKMIIGMDSNPKNKV